MKKVTKILIFALVGILGSGMALADRGRKLPVGAYIKSAKIEILSGDLERYQKAIALLDSLFMNYGPHAEGLYLMGQIMVDFLERAPTLPEKAPYLEKMVAYFDSLHMCCANKDIKKSYRGDCKEHMELADSLELKYWRQFFNSGISKLSTAENLHQELDNETDSITRTYMESDLESSIDSTIEYLNLAYIAIPDSARTYLLLDKAYGLRDDYQTGIEWLKKGLEHSGDSATMIPSLAYDYIQLEDYCGAIPYYRAHAERNPEDVATLTNLSICYYNCNQYDSALNIYQRILAVDPENVSILTNMALYYNLQAGQASDSAGKYQGEDQSAVAMWQQKRDEAFDSSRAYFGRVFELAPDDALAAEQYGILSALLGDCEEAVKGFGRAVELEPEQIESWISLGDCYLTLKNFDEAIAAYEKVVELNPKNVTVWEHLKDLYFETGHKTKLAEAEKKLNELKQ